jgi:NAD(P)-dependent dehydrogenase (short-subunit alcohol dehydrogenase family)
VPSLQAALLSARWLSVAVTLSGQARTHPDAPPCRLYKAALLSLQQTLRDELAPRGVLVGSAMPGVVATPMQARVARRGYGRRRETR